MSEGNDQSVVLRDIVLRIRRPGAHPVAVVTGGATGLRAVHHVHGFEYARDGAGQLGSLDGMPVYHVRSDRPSAIILVDLAELGEWVQYPPPRTFAGNAVGEVLRVGVQELGEVEAEEPLQKQPELARSREGTDLSTEAAIRELRKRVRLRVAEKFTYAVEKPEAATVVEIPG